MLAILAVAVILIILFVWMNMRSTSEGYANKTLLRIPVNARNAQDIINLLYPYVSTYDKWLNAKPSKTENDRYYRAKRQNIPQQARYSTNKYNLVNNKSVISVYNKPRYDYAIYQTYNKQAYDYLLKNGKSLPKNGVDLYIYLDNDVLNSV